MNRSQKEITVQELAQHFETNAGAFLVKVQGMTVNEIQSLRRGLRSCDSKVKVAKRRLVKIAIKDNEPARSLEPYLHDQIAVVFAPKDTAAAAKTIHDFTKKTKLEIVVGLVESQLFDKDKVVRLASIPSREVLLAQLCGLLKAPVSALARSLQAVAEQKGGSSTHEESTQEVTAS